MKFLENLYSWSGKLFGFTFALLMLLFFLMLICSSSSGCIAQVDKHIIVGIAPINSCIKKCNNEICTKIISECVSKDEIFIGPIIGLKF